ncbi:MAG TPA: glycosyltransferase, partial [Proteobacteria bacterium]|nr:glycosyltransferase [Pseudomonadota bacterium]
NKQAALRLCREIMPGIIRRIPDAVLFLVGSNPPPEILALDNGSSIRVTGAVDKILPYLRDSEVLLCPLSLGTGTRLKVLEAMAAGIPVISSNTGCEGIPVSTGKDIILAETNDQFIRETSNLLKSPGLGNQISLKARRLVEDKYSQDEIGRCLTEGLSLTAGPD